MTGFRDSAIDRSALLSPCGGLAVAGTLITYLAYSVVPITSDTLLGARDASELASQFTSMRSLIGLQFMPLVLLVMAGGGLWLLFRRWATRWRFGMSVTVLAASAGTVMAYLAPYLTLNSDFNEAATGISPISLAGPGLWLALLGALLAASGAAWELRTASSTP
jgi:hypothetical protein